DLVWYSEVDKLNSIHRVKQLKDLAKLIEDVPLQVEVSGRVGSETPIRCKYSDSIGVIIVEWAIKNFMRKVEVKEDNDVNTKKNGNDVHKCSHCTHQHEHKCSNCMQQHKCSHCMRHCGNHCQNCNSCHTSDNCKQNVKYRWVRDSEYMRSTSRQVPWYLDDGTGRVRVVGARDASGFCFTEGSRVYEDQSGGTEDIQMLGLTRKENILPIGEPLTVIGEAVKDGNGAVRIQRPLSGGFFYVSENNSVDTLVEVSQGSVRFFKYASIGVGVVGVVCLAIFAIDCIQDILERRRRRRRESQNRVLSPAAVERSDQENRGATGEPKMECVICFGEEYNTVFIPVDRLSPVSETDRADSEDLPPLKICFEDL
ncbi:hypothetical protein Tsubulata_036357, partial [Turnera subulata]